LSKPFELDEMLRIVASVAPAHWEGAGQRP
jgi:hypothetical protein